jgi:uncharacterized protein YjbJ (UPF0337 family)
MLTLRQVGIVLSCRPEPIGWRSEYLAGRLRSARGDDRYLVAPCLVRATRYGSVGKGEKGGRMSSGTGDKAKGRVKEAAGALTGDKKLKSEGKVDQLAGKIKDAVETVIDKAKGALKR